MRRKGAPSGQPGLSHTRKLPKNKFLHFYRYTRSEKRWIMVFLSVMIPICILVVLYENSLPASEKGHLDNEFAMTGSSKELNSLLEKIMSSRNSQNNVVVAIAANYAYRHLAANFVCNLRRLNISNYVLLAMDREMFNLSRDMGIHVFYHDIAVEQQQELLAIDRRDGASEGALFGSRDFIHMSQMKSRLVLQIIRLGYNVVFSDVDVFWFHNPIPILLSYGADVIIQSDAKSGTTQKPNYNLNSGLYYVRASTATSKVFGAITKYGRKVRRSEQKAFNHVLCGAFRDFVAGPGRRIGSQRCVYRKKGVTVKMSTLPRDAFPNGSDDFWTRHNNEASAREEIIAAHANYVQGRDAKIVLMQKRGLWLVDLTRPGSSKCRRVHI